MRRAISLVMVAVAFLAISSSAVDAQTVTITDPVMSDEFVEGSTISVDITASFPPPSTSAGKTIKVELIRTADGAGGNSISDTAANVVTNGFINGLVLPDFEPDRDELNLWRIRVTLKSGSTVLSTSEVSISIIL